MNDTDVISAAQAAEILGTTLNTVVRWATADYLPAAQRGQRGKAPWLFDPATVAELAAKRAAAFDVLGIAPTTGVGTRGGRVA